MEKIRVIIRRHRTTSLAGVVFLKDDNTGKNVERWPGVSLDANNVFSAPVENFIHNSCELVSDVIIEVKNWPKSFPLGQSLFHEPSLLLEWDKIWS